MLPMAEQEFAQAVSGAQLILFGYFARAHQIPQGLGGGVRDPDRGEITGAIAAGQPHGILAIGLHPIPRLCRNEARSNHVAVDAERGELPVQRIPRGPGFVAHPQTLRAAQLRNQFPYRLRAITDRAQLADRAVRLGNGNGDGLGMDIETDMTHCVWHKRSAPSYCGSGTLGSSDWPTHVTATASRSLHSD